MKELKNKLNELGFLKPTIIQEKSYQAFMKNLNAILLSPTGTGKTLAYLIPLINKINPHEGLQSIIIVPTTELALQIKEVLKTLNAPYSSQVITSNEDRLKSINSFKNNPPNLLVITPGRLDNLRKENLINPLLVKYLIIDEADMLFDLDFLSQIDYLVSKVKGNIYLFSATLPDHLLSWARKYFKVELIDVRDKVELNINHHLVFAGNDKDLRLFNLLNTIKPYLCLIFVSKNEDIEPLYKQMLEKGYNVGRLSSLIPVRQRKNIINDIKALKYQYVISSDVGSRGLDFEGISDIVNYDLPYKLEFYVHRSGRTGRMLKEGNVYLFYEDKLSRKIETLKNRGIIFKDYNIKDDKLVLREKKTRTLTDEEVQAIRSVKKPKRVKPGYKKKYQKEVKDALKKVRYKGGRKK